MKLDLKELLAKLMGLPLVVRNESFVGNSGLINKTQTIPSGGTYLIMARANATTGSSVPAVRIYRNGNMLAQNADAGGSTMSYVIASLSSGDVINVEYSATNVDAVGNWNNLAIVKLGGYCLTVFSRLSAIFELGVA